MKIMDRNSPLPRRYLVLKYSDGKGKTRIIQGYKEKNKKLKVQIDKVK